jgi:aspartyl-tRNA(Asn)/glutamyl-tRNA(Gln) amidotransferase subunit A
MYYSDVCTIPSNLSGDPAISIPVGVDGNGLPIGFQVMAPALGEEVMFRVAAEIERLSGFGSRPELATSEVVEP